MGLLATAQILAPWLGLDWAAWIAVAGSASFLRLGRDSRLRTRLPREESVHAPPPPLSDPWSRRWRRDSERPLSSD